MKKNILEIYCSLDDLSVCFSLFCFASSQIFISKQDSFNSSVSKRYFFIHQSILRDILKACFGPKSTVLDTLGCGVALVCFPEAGRVAASVFLSSCSSRFLFVSACITLRCCCVFHISQIRAFQPSHSSGPGDTNQFPVFRWRQNGGADDTDLKLWPNKEAHSCHGQWHLYSAVCCTYCRLSVSCRSHVQLMNGLMTEFLILCHKSPLEEASGFCDSAEIWHSGLKNKKYSRQHCPFSPAVGRQNSGDHRRAGCVGPAVGKAQCVRVAVTHTDTHKTLSGIYQVHSN